MLIINQSMIFLENYFNNYLKLFKMTKFFSLTIIFLFVFSTIGISQNTPVQSFSTPVNGFSTKSEKEAGMKKSVPKFSSQAEKDEWLRKQELQTKDPAKMAKLEQTISTESEKIIYLQSRQNKNFVSKEEFNSLPAEKRAAMKADKNFIIEK